MKLKRISLLAAAFWLGGCSALLEHSLGDQASLRQNELAGTRWRVETIAGKSLPGMIESNVAFDADGRISGTAGCNRFSGRYRLNDGELSVANLITTRKICFPAIMAQEESLLRVLEGARRIERDSGLLLLESANERQVSRMVEAGQAG